MSSVLHLLLRSRHSSLSLLLRARNRHAVLHSSAISQSGATKQPRPLSTQHLKQPLSVTPHHQLCTISRTATASKPRAVIFDLGGVVVPSPQAIFDCFEEKYNLEKGSLVATIKSTGNGGAFAKMERGEYSVEQFCEPFRAEYLAFANHDLSMEQIREFVQQLSDFTKVTPHSCVLDMFKKLQSNGIKVAILTNNFRRDSGRTVFPEETLDNVDLVS